MADEKSIITIEQFEIAKKDRSHIAIQTLDSLGTEYWGKLYRNLKENITNVEEQDLCRKAFMPYANKLEGEKFSLMPLEIVSIWARAMELFHNNNYPRYDLSRVLACVYGTMQIASLEWRNLYEKITWESSYLKKLSEKDRTNAVNFRNRLDEIHTNLDELEFYRNGTKEDIISLVKLVVQGDEEAKKRLENLKKHQKEHDGEFLGVLNENSQGMLGLFLDSSNQ